MSPTEETVSPALEELLEEYAARLQAGEALDPAAFARGHPEHAELLGRVLPTMQVLAQLSASGETRPAAEGLGAGPGDAVPGQLGDFRIGREVGRGGMGIVYEAEQVSLGRRVALKVLPFAGTLDQKQLQRFKNESQAAAHLQHQHIVPVHFVGCERGVHFYAMQFIDGQTLAQVIAELRRSAGDQTAPAPADRPPSATQFPAAPPKPEEDATRAYRPSPRHPGLAAPDTVPQAGLATERSHRTANYFKMVARLGIQAAEALQHAHDFGVVHRDVKPGNLLVDGRGYVWLTDFGLAHMQTEASLTLSGDLIGTVRYMSPEQALANRVLIDERTDVYSLGATLYELLTLRPAFRGNDRQELLRQIAFDEPVRPSRINKEVPAELETVVLKAMEKRPEDRYRTAEELAEDLRRVLKDEPIRARRPTKLQRLRKWCRRHQSLVRMAAVSAALFMVLLTAAAAVAIWLAARATEAESQALADRDRAEEQAAIAQEVTLFLMNDLLDQASCWAQADRRFMADPQLTVRQALDRAAQRIGDRFLSQPLVEAAVRQAIGRAYQAVGKPKTAIEHLQKSVSLHRAQLGADHRYTLDTMQSLSFAYEMAGQAQRALMLLEQVVAKRKEKLGADHPDTLSSMNMLAYEYHTAGLLAKAQALQEQVLAKTKEKLGSDHPNTLSSMCNLATVYYKSGLLAKAQALQEQVMAKAKEKLGPDHPNTLRAMGNLANTYMLAGQMQRALSLQERTLTMRKKILGPDHPETVLSMCNLASDYSKVGKVGKARQLYEQGLAKRRETLGSEHPWTLETMRDLGNLYREAGQLGKSISLLEEALRICKTKIDPYNRLTLEIMNDLGVSYGHSGNRAKEVALYEEALAKMKIKLGPNDPLTLRTMNNLAFSYSKARQWGKALALYKKALAKMKVKLDAKDPVTYLTITNLANAYLNAGQEREALPLYEEALAKRKKNLGADHPDTLQSMNNLAWFLATCSESQLRNPARAVRLASKATQRAAGQGTFWNTLGVARYRAGEWKGALEAIDRSMKLRKGGDSFDWIFAAMAHWQLGEKEQARKWYERAMRWMEKNRPKGPELDRFRHEAAELLGVKELTAGRAKEKATGK
jgi:serine/threonine protein kinase